MITPRLVISLEMFNVGVCNFDSWNGREGAKTLVSAHDALMHQA